MVQDGDCELMRTVMEFGSEAERHAAETYARNNGLRIVRNTLTYSVLTDDDGSVLEHIPHGSYTLSNEDADTMATPTRQEQARRGHPLAGTLEERVSSLETILGVR